MSLWRHVFLLRRATRGGIVLDGVVRSYARLVLTLLVQIHAGSVLPVELLLNADAVPVQGQLGVVLVRMRRLLFRDPGFRK